MNLERLQFHRIGVACTKFEREASTLAALGRQPESDEEMAPLRHAGAKVVAPPVSAAAFSGPRITFIMIPNLLPVELIAMR